MSVKEDGGVLCDLHQSDGNEPTIELATFLGEWERSNMSDGQLWERNGRREAVVISGCGDWEHLGCCQAVTVN